MFNISNDFLTSNDGFTQDLISFAQDPQERPHITDVSIVVSYGESTSISPEDGAIATVSQGESTSVSITLYCGQKKLSFSQNGLNTDALKKAIVDNAILIHHVPDNKYAGLVDKNLIAADQDQSALELYDAAPMSIDKLKDYALELEHAALSQPNIMSSNRVNVGASRAHVLKASTNGLKRFNQRTSYSASAQIVAKDPTDGHMEVEGDGAHAIHFSDMPSATLLGQDIGQAANAKLNMVTPQTGQMPVVFGPEAASTFFGSVLSAIDAGSVYAQRTFLKDKIGQQVMSSAVTLIDDPSIKRSHASQNTDSAGLKSQPITFIENGILKTFNRSVTESRQINMDPIGREDGPTNILVKPGDLSRDDLVADISEGIYVTDFAGGTADINSGIHSREALGFMIKDGKITDQAVGGFIVSGNLKDMFMAVTLANDCVALPDPRQSMSVPTLRFDELTIAGS